MAIERNRKGLSGTDVDSREYLGLRPNTDGVEWKARSHEGEFTPDHRSLRKTNGTSPYGQV